MTSTFRFRLCLVLLASLSAGLGPLVSPAAAEGHSLGVGLHYWRALDDLVDDDFDVDEDGLAGIVSYQYGGFVRFELDLEIFPDGFGGASDSAYSPIAFVVVGSGLYGAVGVGVTVSSAFEDDVSDPFWAARVGVDWDFFPRLSLDVNLNYRADTFSELDQADSDTVTLGAILRFSF